MRGAPRGLTNDLIISLVVVSNILNDAFSVACGEREHVQYSPCCVVWDELLCWIIHDGRNERDFQLKSPFFLFAGEKFPFTYIFVR